MTKQELLYYSLVGDREKIREFIQRKRAEHPNIQSLRFDDELKWQDEWIALCEKEAGGGNENLKN